MARKKTVKPEQNELLMPALALSMLVFVLVGALVTATTRTTPQSNISANNRQARLLTKDNKVDDLEADLLLLQEDSLDSEISVLEQLQ